MCGISGLWTNFGNRADNFSYLKKMTDALYNRGPDDFGFWSDSNEMLFLGHRRLSILDLSSNGHQPMISHDGRFVISFNGEIYNHSDLRIEIQRKVKAIKWQSHSDTEVLLELISIYGLENALKKCSGMFALALWDKKNKSLQIARDRFGEKPLYYGFSGPEYNRSFIFASDLSAIKSFQLFNNPIDPFALTQLINLQAISSPNSIYKGIFQLPPGSILNINSPKEETLETINCWWNVIDDIEKSISDPINSEEEAKLILESNLRQSIANQSIADVPLGTFLSGGIDSSLITALLQSQSNKKIRTFTIGFEEKEFNEAPFSKKVAKHLGTDHNEIYLTSKDAQNLIPKLNNIYSEPFADPSQIPTYLVCREARNSGLKVALSGDGGDELFGGYNRYIMGEKIWKTIDPIPLRIRKRIGNLGLRLSSSSFNKFSQLSSIIHFGIKIQKLSQRLSYVKNSNEFYYSLISQCQDPNILFDEDYKKESFYYLPESFNCKLPSAINHNFTSKMMLFDTLNYLPNDILTKVDRASMASSLEIRAPFLDHNVFKIAWRINMNFKINSNFKKNSSKLILRKILYDHIPPELIERPKAGFGIPLAEWLRGPLKSWASDLLSKDNIKKSSYLKFDPVSKLWQDHLDYKSENSSKLWPIIMWQSWLDSNK